MILWKLPHCSKGQKSCPPPLQIGASLQLSYQVLLLQCQPLSQMVVAAQQSTENRQVTISVFLLGQEQGDSVMR